MAERILVIRLGAVGDVVRTLPSVSALRSAYPKAWITWLVEPASFSLLRLSALQASMCNRHNFPYTSKFSTSIKLLVVTTSFHHQPET